MKVLRLDKAKRSHILTIQKDQCELEKIKKSPELLSTMNGGAPRFLATISTNQSRPAFRENLMPRAFRKTILSLCLTQQRIRLESVNNFIPTVAKTEETSSFTIYPFQCSC